MKLSKGFWAVAVVLLILITDQISKIWIKTNLMLGADIPITPWFQLRFVENNGMAMGMEVLDKTFLTLFRIVASGALIYYLCRLIKQKVSTGYLICVSLILAGAMGNIIDCLFYGVIFDHSYGQVATLFPPGGGYSTWMHGKVVDMFYFPFFTTTWPSWIPYIGDTEFEFFRYIFNVADASISVGVVVLLLFYRKTFAQSLEKKEIEKKETED